MKQLRLQCVLVHLIIVQVSVAVGMLMEFDFSLPRYTTLGFALIFGAVMGRDAAIYWERHQLELLRKRLRREDDTE